MICGLVPVEWLLEWTVEDGWDPLCALLEKSVPDEPFPHANDAAEWAGHEMKSGTAIYHGRSEELGYFRCGCGGVSGGMEVLLGQMNS